MKIIYLDIDGVLNNATTKERFLGFIGIDQRLLGMFLKWYNQRDYKIILSSTWRLEETFREHLEMQGLSWINVTPRGFKGRGNEVAASLDAYAPEKYVILDDYGPSEFLKYQRPFLVQTSAYKGLEPKKLVRIDQLMGYYDAPPQGDQEDVEAD